MKDINLVAVNLNDIELIRGWRNSPEVSSYMYDESYISEDQQREWFTRINTDVNSMYWIIEYDNKKLGLASPNLAFTSAR
jgi:RimJ/RimL family protein N-acetyltransferase